MTSPSARGHGLKRPRDVHDVHDESDSSASLPKHQRQQSPPHERSLDAANVIGPSSWSAQSSQPPASGLQDETEKVFRLKHIPHWRDAVADIQLLLKDLLSLGDNTSVSIHSVACSPYDPAERIATLSFSQPPATLTMEKSYRKAGNEWRFKTHGPNGEACFPTLDTHFLGFTPLHRERDSDCTTDIIALSDLNGHAFGSFKEKGGNFMWLRDALSKDMIQARILIYGYDTSIIGSNSFQGLRDLGIQLREGLRSIRQNGSGSSIHRPMVLIGHSLGGTVVKDAIIQMSETDEIDKANLKSIYGILFFGVPNQGMAIESLLPMAGQNPSQYLIHALRKGSEVLRHQQEQFPSAFSFQDSVIISFYETLESPTAVEVNGRWTMSGPSAVLVDASSATHGRHWESRHPFIYPVNRSHSDMVKFTGNDDSVYRVVLERLKLLEAGARNVIPQRHMENGMDPPERLLQEEQGRVPPDIARSLRTLTRSIACLESLAFPEQLWRQDEIVQAKLNGTCNWITRHPQYFNWLQQSSGVLWILGTPGAGKSTVMKYIAQDLEERFQWNNGLVATFFIHGRGNSRQREHIGIFRALLNQLLAYLPEELSMLTKIFQERHKKMGTISKNWNWGEGDLRSFLESVLPKASRKRCITICIDALDECGKKPAIELANYLSQLARNASQLQGSLRVCCSCRHYPTLSFNQKFRINVEDENHDDINTFLQDYLKDIPSNERTEIIEEISRRTQGVFQWAVLVAARARELKMEGTRLRKIMEKIKEIPRELKDLYAALMENFDQDSRAQAVKLLQWVCFSREPLTTKELQHALAVDAYMDHRTSTEYQSGDNYTDTLEDLERAVKNLSRGLVHITNDRVQFIHQSAQDYFLTRGLQDLEGNDDYSVAARGHFQISRSCIRYMEMDDIAAHHFPNAPLDMSNASLITQRCELSGKFPLAEYSVRFIHFHLKAVESEKMPQNDLWDLFHWPNDGNIANTWRKCAEIFGLSRTRKWSDEDSRLVHILAAAGIESALDHLLANHGHNSQEFDAKDRALRTPLYWALWNNHTSIAHKLLSTGIVDLGPFGPFGHTALHLAIMTEDVSLMHKIIRMGAPINLKNTFANSPLSMAIDLDKEEAARTLVEAGAALDAGWGTNGGITHYAVKRRNSKLLDLVLAMGASVEMIDQNGQTALFKSVVGFPATENLLYRLLEEGARLDVVDLNGDTPLSHAVNIGNEDLVQCLINYGATIGLENASGESAVTKALESGNEVLTALLLQRITEDGGCW